ncbi:ABC transporter substrate-binding protein [Leptothrix ochracea]|uniref:ABC transporter substrate-binding protein n=1 Tax=Leptothrix ochracea TaxID=735331 RepID=UPI0034E1E050
MGQLRNIMRGLLLALGLGGAVGGTVDIGAAASIPPSPQRIVSLLPSLTEAVCALGACDQLVATDRYSNAPAQVLALPKVGGLEDAQIERIVALKPDVVLATRATRAVERLQALGLRVVLIEATSHAEAHQMLTRLGEVLGRAEQAQKLWQQIEAQVQQAVARVPAALRGRKVYVEVDAGPYAAGPTSFLGETLARLGLHNIVPASFGPFPKLNPEFVVRAQPDLILVMERSPEELARRPGWTQLRALQRQQVCAFERARYDILVRPGPRLGEAAQLLADCLTTLAGRAVP